MNEHERIDPARFEPPGAAPRRRRGAPHPAVLVAAAVLLPLIVALWFVFTAHGVTLVFEPEADSVSVRGGGAISLGGLRLMRPGRYTVAAERKGYHRLEREIDVVAGAELTFRFAFEKLPGRLRVVTKPSAASLSVDGEAAGSTPIESLVLAPGSHDVELRARRHETHRERVEIEGMDLLQTLEVELVPAWAPVGFSSRPPGATLLVDAEEQGKTPITAELGAGTRRAELVLDGYEPWSGDVVVGAGEPQEVPTIDLVRARGRLHLTSEPGAASVTVAGEFRGRTPIDLTLPPGETTTIQLARAGYESARRSVAIASGAKEAMHVELAAILGSVRVRATPTDAMVFVDGDARGGANQSLSLTAEAHRIEIRKPGYVTHRTILTPKPGFEQELEVTLRSETEAAAASLAKTIEAPAGQRLRLVRAGAFTMGAARREQGRLPNEGQRSVRLTRAFYIGTHEVTNRAFREFRKGHSSGIVASRTLDNEDMPVVRVSWNDAVAFCNWLSERAGLAPAYQGETLVTPIGTGFRLPSEAEWEYAARFAEGRGLKYAWGAEMPPAGLAGNYADVSAAALLGAHLREYDDHHVAVAPVGRFTPSALGLFDIGGNVAEWVHDRYAGTPATIGGAESDPFGPTSGSAHTVRGSSWRHGRITELRLSYRESGIGPRDDLGFRVARYAE